MGRLRDLLGSVSVATAREYVAELDRRERSDNWTDSDERDFQRLERSIPASAMREIERRYL